MRIARLLITSFTFRECRMLDGGNISQTAASCGRIAYSTNCLSFANKIVPFGVREGKDRAIQVAHERSGNPSLDEVEEVDLSVHAAGHGRVKVGDVAHARHPARVQRHGVVAVELGRLASILETCWFSCSLFVVTHLFVGSVPF